MLLVTPQAFTSAHLCTCTSEAALRFFLAVYLVANSEPVMLFFHLQRLPMPFCLAPAEAVKKIGIENVHFVTQHWEEDTEGKHQNLHNNPLQIC